MFNIVFLKKIHQQPLMNITPNAKSSTIALNNGMRAFWGCIFKVMTVYKVHFDVILVVASDQLVHQRVN